jgi:hypothetical protein
LYLTLTWGRIFSQAGNELGTNSFPARNKLSMLFPYTSFSAGTSSFSNWLKIRPLDLEPKSLNIVHKYKGLQTNNERDFYHSNGLGLRVFISIVWWVLVPTSVTDRDPDPNINRDPIKASPDWMVPTCLRTGRDWIKTNRY